jgi:hypothetical protein
VVMGTRASLKGTGGAEDCENRSISDPGAMKSSVSSVVTSNMCFGAMGTVGGSELDSGSLDVEDEGILPTHSDEPEGR